MLAFSLFGKTKIDTKKRERGYNMLMGYTSLNTNRIKYIRVIIISVIWTLIISVGVHALSAAQSKEIVQIVKPRVPLLLNSDVVQSENAEVSVIIWFENKEIPRGIWTSKPTTDWIWTYKELQRDNEEVSVTLTGQRLLNKSEERNLFAWYTTMVPRIEKAGGRIYLDERIPQAIDIAAYLSKTNAIPTQWVLLDNMISTAAYQNNIETGVMAGQDQINIQLLSRGKNTLGQSVLAIPVLLKQF